MFRAPNFGSYQGPGQGYYSPYRQVAVLLMSGIFCVVFVANAILSSVFHIHLNDYVKPTNHHTRQQIKSKGASTSSFGPHEHPPNGGRYSRGDQVANARVSKARALVGEASWWEEVGQFQRWPSPESYNGVENNPLAAFNPTDIKETVLWIYHRHYELLALRERGNELARRNTLKEWDEENKRICNDPTLAKVIWPFVVLEVTEYDWYTPKGKKKAMFVVVQPRVYGKQTTGAGILSFRGPLNGHILALVVGEDITEEKAATLLSGDLLTLSGTVMKIDPPNFESLGGPIIYFGRLQLAKKDYLPPEGPLGVAPSSGPE